ncbi:glycosyltransferase family 4 protein [Rhodocaloribacter litoris]|uniref:glycosyltransferase family 4 protein n=1 Tax=Rhodocaloribacter litoris TaxID=2558931 RepID=UPI00141E456F|nr:glycosyltransferase family 4 protein [Rhodocaloribacter litoris]QXD16186.1 glycosyltransferase family 4 protein [Rhodocaloribacter litoris]
MTRPDPAGRVLLVQHSASRDGSTFSGLLLADGLRDAGWWVHVVFGHPGPMEAVYAERGHATSVVPHKNWLRRAHPARFMKDAITEYRRARAFDRCIAQVRPDVVYVNSVVSLAAVVAARRAGVPVVWHLRELFADVGGEMHAPVLLKPLVRRIIARLPDRLVAPSRAIAENLLGAAAEQVTLVPNAAGRRFFEEERTRGEARRVLRLPENGLILGVPGTLRPMKGHTFFFEAVASLAARYPSLTLAITGHGAEAYEQALQARVQELGLAGRTRFLGSIANMPAFYRACDVVCVPSRAEPFGRTVIEAMAVGTPVVATAVGGIREIVRHEETGLLVPYGDHTALASALDRLLGDADLRARLVEAARRDACERFHERVYQTRLGDLVSQTGGNTDGHSL